MEWKIFIADQIPGKLEKHSSFDENVYSRSNKKRKNKASIDIKIQPPPNFKQTYIQIT